MRSRELAPPGRARRAVLVALAVGAAGMQQVAVSSARPASLPHLDERRLAALGERVSPRPGTRAGAWRPPERPEMEGRGGRRPASSEGRGSDAPRGPRPNGSLRRVKGESRLHGDGVVYRFMVEVERHTRVAAHRFAERVEDILFAPRGWTRGGNVGFRRVSSEPYSFRVILASRATTDRLCAPALTHGMYSCHNDGLVVINLWRWRQGADSYRRLSRYRTYVVNHEVGHALGHGHLGCSGNGPAPVMMQQTIGVGTCAPNPWPLRSELR